MLLKFTFGSQGLKLGILYHVIYFIVNKTQQSASRGLRGNDPQYLGAVIFKFSFYLHDDVFGVVQRKINTSTQLNKDKEQ